MGRLTEIISIVNHELPFDSENYNRLDSTDPETRKEIIKLRRELKSNTKSVQ